MYQVETTEVCDVSGGFNRGPMSRVLPGPPVPHSVLTCQLSPSLSPPCQLAARKGEAAAELANARGRMEDLGKRIKELEDLARETMEANEQDTQVGRRG